MPTERQPGKHANVLSISELNVADNDGSKVFVTGVVQNVADPTKLIAVVQQIGCAVRFPVH